MSKNYPAPHVVKPFITLARAAAFGIGSTCVAQACEFVTVDLSPFANKARNSFVNGSTFPTGLQTMDGVPMQFASANSPQWCWAAASATPTLSVPLKLPRARRVYTVINTMWGQPGPASYASVTFVGSSGATYAVGLLGNKDVRDFNNAIWTNLIQGPGTVQIFSNGAGQRLDRQKFDLPSSFAGEDLVEIRFADSGSDGFQRMFVVAITVCIAPACSADLDASGVVDSSDLGILLSSWGECAGCEADVDRSGFVDSVDLGMVLSGWGACP
jgi:hypothetical protein